MTRRKTLFLTLIAVSCALISACSINKIAIKAVSDALTREGSAEVFTGDSDPILVGDAIPFAIKMYESLLAANPKHLGLINTTGSLFVMYANAFVQKPAEQMPQTMYVERQAELERARKLYMRGLDILYRGLEIKYPGFGSAFHDGNPQNARSAFLSKLKKDDVPALYWAAAAGASAYSINPFDIGLGRRFPEFLALAERAYELDPNFNSGALDDFLLLYYASAPELMGGDKTRAEMHFERALKKSGGLLAGPYVSYAKAVSIPAQDYDTFKACLDAALSIDPATDPSNRLVNIILQREARYLLDSASRFFIYLETDDNWDWEYENW